MKIASIRHKGLARFVEKDDSSRIDQRLVTKLRLQVSFLMAMQHSDECKSLPFWKAH